MNLILLHVNRVWIFGCLGFMLYLGMAGLVLAAEKAQEMEAMTRPPMPVGARAEVYIGESIDVPLEVEGRVSEPLKILIRKQPRHGELGEVRLLPGGRGGVVEYTSSARAKAGTDSFTFAAQSSDSPVSASAQVVIALKLRPARLEYARELDFGSVALGGEAVRDVMISNTGAEDFTLEPGGSGPWTIDGDSPLLVPGGGATVLRLVFRPAAAGDFKTRIRLSPDGREFLLVKGGSFAPVEWGSGGLVFSAANRSTGRSTVRFQNTSQQERVVEFNWPGFLNGPGRIVLQPGADLPVEVRLNAPPDFAHSGDVVFRSGDYSALLPFKIDPAPASVDVEPAGKLDLGEISLGETARGAIKLKNTGGLAARLRISPPPAISVVPDAQTILLEPGQQKDFTVFMRPEAEGSFSSPLTVESTGEAAISLRVALLVKPKRQERTPTASGSEPKEAPAPMPIECYLWEITPHSFAIVWKNPPGLNPVYQVERRTSLKTENGKLREVWEKWDRAKLQSVDEAALLDLLKATSPHTTFRALERPGMTELTLAETGPPIGDWTLARVRKLPAGASWTVRVVGTDGGQELVSPRLAIQTPPLPPWRIPPWAAVLIGLAAAYLIFFFLRKAARRRALESSAV